MVHSVWGKGGAIRNIRLLMSARKNAAYGHPKRAECTNPHNDPESSKRSIGRGAGKRAIKLGQRATQLNGRQKYLLVVESAEQIRNELWEMWLNGVYAA